MADAEITEGDFLPSRFLACAYMGLFRLAVWSLRCGQNPLSRNRFFENFSSKFRLNIFDEITWAVGGLMSAGWSGKHRLKLLKNPYVYMVLDTYVTLKTGL